MRIPNKKVNSLQKCCPTSILYLETKFESTPSFLDRFFFSFYKITVRCSYIQRIGYGHGKIIDVLFCNDSIMKKWVSVHETSFIKSSKEIKVALLYFHCFLSGGFQVSQKLLFANAIRLSFFRCTDKPVPINKIMTL